VIAWGVGPSSEPGVLLRSGAMVRGRIDDGEWWRLISCVFIHVGSVHLAVNALGLFFLGRIVEELFGKLRTIAIYGGAGVAGAVASYLASPAGISAGASGAISACSAVFIELTPHCQRARSLEAACGVGLRRPPAQAGIGFLYPVIDRGPRGRFVRRAALEPCCRRTRGGPLHPPSRNCTRHHVRRVRCDRRGDGRAHVDPDSHQRATQCHVLGEIVVTAPATWIAQGDLVDRTT
jgi:hypothetical protein